MFSSEHRIISKAEKQPSPNTHATRDPKGKSVIEKSSRNTKGGQCISVKTMVTLLHNVPIGIFLVRKADDDEIEIVVYKPTGSATDSDDDVRISSVQMGVIRCSHTTIRDENWRKSSVFHTCVTHEGENYKLIIDKGSYANIVAKTSLEKISFKAEPHPDPYNVN